MLRRVNPRGMWYARGVMSTDFDVIIVGGGHAGSEAAHAAARLGARAAMVVLDPSKVGAMSCNPAIGGLAKGQLVREVDALGGLMGRITDRAALQYKRLNSSKGPAVRSSRAQCDKKIYAHRMQEALALVPGLTIIAAEAIGIESASGQVTGVRLRDGSIMSARAVVITSGTFLKAVMFTGEEKSEGGRAGDAAANGLSVSLLKLGFKLRRLKTGTPPRLHKDSIDWSKTVAQTGDLRPIPFSFFIKEGTQHPELPQIAL